MFWISTAGEPRLTLPGTAVLCSLTLASRSASYPIAMLQSAIANRRCYGVVNRHAAALGLVCGLVAIKTEKKLIIVATSLLGGVSLPHTIQSPSIVFTAQPRTTAQRCL